MNPNIIAEFMRFAQTFRGNPQETVQQLLNSGQISQDQYNQAVQTAQQLRQMLPPSVHRR